MTITNAGVEYTLPSVHLLQESGIGTSEFGARVAYDSFDKSENDCIAHMNEVLQQDMVLRSEELLEVNSIEHSDLLDSLAWVHHHHSVLEHCNLTYLIKGVSRGVLQELVRHRIASYTVRSTRYTMQSILNAFIASYDRLEERKIFRDLVPNFSIFHKDSVWFVHECEYVFSKLKQQLITIGYEEFFKLCLSKNAQENWNNNTTVLPTEDMFKLLESSKPKRNVGDAFKHIVTDNWYTDLVMTMNLRSLKNFFDLRD